MCLGEALGVCAFQGIIPFKLSNLKTKIFGNIFYYCFNICGISNDVTAFIPYMVSLYLLSLFLGLIGLTNGLSVLLIFSKGQFFA